MTHDYKITRSGKPGKYDQLEQGTECIVLKRNNKCDIYIQRNADENNPQWALLEEDVEIDNDVGRDNQ